MDILFLFKKLVGTIMSPLPIVTILLFYGCFLLAKSRVERKITLTFYSATLFLFLSSSTLVANSMLRPLEEIYPVYKDTISSVDNIVVLGCYHRTDDARPMLDNIHDCSISRMIEALRLSLVYPNAQIITSGSDANDGDDLSHAEVIKQALIALGVKENRIKAVNGSKDTKAESINLRELLINKSNLLLSEATHLKRAVRLFDKQGIVVTPVPCRYMTSSNFELSSYLFVPNEEAIKATERLIYEALGNVWVFLNN